jgi:hypothetical protein
MAARGRSLALERAAVTRRRSVVRIAARWQRKKTVASEAIDKGRMEWKSDS